MSKKVKILFNTEVWLLDEDRGPVRLRAIREELPPLSSHKYRVTLIVDENYLIATKKLDSATLCTNFSLIEAGKFLERTSMRTMGG